MIRADARSVKSTDWPGFGTVKVVVTGFTVPNGNSGMETFAFVELTTVMPCSPIPVFTISTVTEPGPDEID